MKRLLATVVTVILLLTSVCEASEEKAFRIAEEKAFRIIDLNEAYMIPEQVFGSDGEAREISFGTKTVYAVYQGEFRIAEFSDEQQAVTHASLYSNTCVLREGLLWSGGNWLTSPAYDVGIYKVYKGGVMIELFYRGTAAVNFIEERTGCQIYGKTVISHNYERLPDEKLWELNAYGEFDDLTEAVSFARAKKNAAVIAKQTVACQVSGVIWQIEEAPDYARVKNVPHISQMPDLPRGCEITSLAMLMNYNGIEVSKLSLAKEVKKSPHPYDDPNNGFIGDMYSFRNHGLGVYHKPIAELAKLYLPNRIVDMTGCDFEDLYYFISHGQPVWVITNSWYKKLPQSEFEHWETPSGMITITYREHSVLITGYDAGYIYIHDPLSGAYMKKPKADFIDAWHQMGSQAVAAVPEW